MDIGGGTTEVADWGVEVWLLPPSPRIYYLFPVRDLLITVCHFPLLLGSTSNGGAFSKAEGFIRFFFVPIPRET